MMKVMIVDDEYFVRHGLITSISWEQHGYQVVGEAENGEEALEKVFQLKPDILLTDIKMPVMDGMEFIKKIRDMKLDTSIIILTCYDDFKYAQQAVHYGVDEYVLKLSSKPQDILMAVNRIRDKLFDTRKHMKKSMETGIRFFQKAMVKNENIPYPVFVINAQISSKDSLGEKYGLGLMNEWLQEDMEELFAREGHKIFWTGGGNYLIFYNHAERNRVVSFCKTLYAKVHAQVGMNMSFGVSGCNDGKVLEEKLEEARQALDYRFYAGLGSIHFFDEIKYREAQFQINENKVILFFESMDIQGMKNYAVSMMDALEYMRFPDFISQCVEFLFIMVCYLRKNGKYIPENYKNLENLFKYFSAFDYYPVLKGEMINAIEVLFELMKNDYQEQKAIISRIKHAIERNHAMELSLEFFANEVNLSYCYLSTLFKNEVGYSFKEYLNMVRINKAKELLKDIRDNVYLISEKVGFTNPYYFSKVFKKYTGMTPVEYRNRFGAVV